MTQASQESSASEHGAPLSLRRKVDYGVFRIADILVMQNMALYVTTYYTIVWMIPPAWLKWAKPLIKIFDVVTDPIVGQVSDNLKGRWGRRRPFVLFGGIFMAVIFWIFWSPKYALFWIPEPSVKNIFVFYLVCYLLYFTAHTLCVIPYNALGAELSSDQDERTRIFSLRHLIALPAVWVATLTFVLATNKSLFASEKEGMPVAAALVSLAIIALSVYTFLRTKENPQVQRQAKMGTVEAIRITFVNRPFMFLCMSSFFFWGGYLFITQFGAYLIIYKVYGGDRSGFAGLVSLSTFAMIVIAFPWNRIVNRMAIRFDKRKCFRVMSAAGLLIPFATLIAFDSERPLMYLFLTVGMALGAINLEILPFAMMADIADMDELKTRRRREGAFAGVYNGMYKAGLMVAPFFSYYFAELSGFDPRLEQQTPETIRSMMLFMFFFTAAAMTLSFVFALLYSLRREDVEAAQKELAARRAAAAGH